MKRAGWLVAFLLLLSCTAALAQEPKVMPQLVVSARFVYVTSYDGPPWSGNVLPQDRQAIVDVQDSLMKWGKYILVYRPEEADLIMIVQRRGGEDVLAIYDNKPFNGSPLWRGMQQGGLDTREMTLMTKFQRAVDKAEPPKK